MGETKRKDTSKEIAQVDKTAKTLPDVTAMVKNIFDDALKAVDEFPVLKQTITTNADIDNIIMYRTLVKCPHCGYSMFWERNGWSCWRCKSFVLHAWMDC